MISGGKEINLNARVLLILEPKFGNDSLRNIVFCFFFETYLRVTLVIAS